MKDLLIEWRHLDADGETCDRCSNTGQTLKKVIMKLKETAELKDMNIVFKEVKLAENDISQSNMILFNNIPLEEVLSETSVVETSCPSCSTIVGKNTCCRAVKQKENIYEDIPYEIIYNAAIKASKI